RPAARQMVTHGHIKVNGRKVNIPSYALKPNDVVEVKDSKVSKQLALRGLELSTTRIVPSWLAVDKEKLRGVVLRIPTMVDIQPIANVQSVVEFYSR
ncbi:MAG: S4 domain-containing protein, partial [Verrucomicrobiia bacterium]